MLNAEFDPAALIDPQHHASLIVQGLIPALERSDGGEGARCRHAPEMTIIADEAVMGVAPEVGLLARAKPQLAFVQPEVGRRVEPTALRDLLQRHSRMN